MDRQDATPSVHKPDNDSAYQGIIRSTLLPLHAPETSDEREAVGSNALHGEDEIVNAIGDRTSNTPDNRSPRRVTFAPVALEAVVVTRPHPINKDKPVPPIPSEEPEPVGRALIAYGDVACSGTSGTQRATRSPPEIIAPTPRRDTIHNIIDRYDSESFLSADTLISEGEDEDEPLDEHDVHRGGGFSLQHSDACADEEERMGGEHGPDGIDLHATDDAIKFGKSGEHGENGEDDGDVDVDLIPPGPIFDLTPGREPSPARFKHGEPLRTGESSRARSSRLSFQPTWR